MNGGCEPGAVCVDTTSTASTCRKFCDDDTDCEAPGGLCVYPLDDGNGGLIPGVMTCTDNCDPVTNAGCAVGACRLLKETTGLMRNVTLCGESGAGMQGDSCAKYSDCAPQFTCTATARGKVCSKWCELNQPNCPGGTNCTAVVPPPVLGNVAYGVCL